ncbi:MAG: arsenate reductase family protein [Christensenellales bacterium]|jgi:arsenate reductase
MVLLCYPKCGTCAKAKAWLDNQGIAYTYRDIQKENPSASELKAWHNKSGLPLKRFFNTSGLAYRRLELKDKLKDMDQEAQYALLATDGLLVKRPLLISDDFVLTGFQMGRWEDALL